MKLFSPLAQRFFDFFPFVVVFVSSLFHPYDPDLGWHLKYGQYFFQDSKILKENIFSTDMPNYHWVNSSWLVDLISYLAFSGFGFLGLAVLAAGVITATFYFFARAAKLDYFEKALIFPLLLYLLAPLNSVSFKGQLFSLLFTGILIFLLKEYEEKKSKLIFLMVPLFLIWSNIHGQFILGLVIFGISIFLYLLKLVLSHPRGGTGSSFAHFLCQCKHPWGVLLQSRTLIIVFAASAIAAVVNPFGFNVYMEGFKHFGNPWQKYILEWLPQEELSVDWWKQLGVGIILFLSSLYIVFSGELISKLTSLVVIPFYVFSFLVRRYLWTTYYLAIPFLQPMVSFLKPESKKYANISATIILLVFIIITFTYANPFARTRNMTWQSYCDKFQRCSPGAAQFLSENHFDGELLTFYDWGGYLIWNFPEVKPSIDGRMHLWQDETGYSAFAYYYPFEQDLRDIDESRYGVVLMSPVKPMYDRLLELVDEGRWRLAYEDDYAGVFIRN